MAKINPLLFIQQVQQEIAKVSWPTRKETMVTTVMVFIISIIMAIFFLMADGLIATMINMILR